MTENAHATGALWLSKSETFTHVVKNDDHWLCIPHDDQGRPLPFGNWRRWTPTDLALLAANGRREYAGNVNDVVGALRQLCTPKPRHMPGAVLVRTESRWADLIVINDTASCFLRSQTGDLYDTVHLDSIEPGHRTYAGNINDVFAALARLHSARVRLGTDKNGLTVFQGEWLRDSETGFVMRAYGLSASHVFLSQYGGKGIVGECAYHFDPTVGDEVAKVADCDQEAYRLLRGTPTGPGGLLYAVISRADQQDGAKGIYELATRQLFSSMEQARTYAAGISGSREPVVIEGRWRANNGVVVVAVTLLYRDGVIGEGLLGGTNEFQATGASHFVSIKANGLRLPVHHVAGAARREPRSEVFDLDWL